MSDTAKQKSNNKFYFVMEDGEISDIEEDDRTEKEEEKKRTEERIKSFSESVRSRENSNVIVQSGEMDIASDDEECTNKIDLKPVALTVTFHDDVFSKRHKGVIETRLVYKYGPEYVDSNNNCIFVSHDAKSVEIETSLSVPTGAISFVFHDEKFSEDNRLSILDFCQTLFGSSKVTCEGNWLIEVLSNDFLDFAVDTEPYYNKSLVYDKPNKQTKTDASQNGRSNQTCFNCLGSHSLKDCYKPKNYNVINKNRKEFQKSKIAKRYHREVDKFSNFAPGNISEELREALGLTPNQLPLHIYNMRKYGYPPGWLKEASIAHSGVTVYGKQGVVPEQGDEEGEVFEEGEKDIYDIKKLVSFPGFNTPVPPNVIDEWERFESEPISEENSLEHLVMKLQPSALKAYKKRVLQEDSNSSKELRSDDSSPSSYSLTQTNSIDSRLDSPSTSCSTPVSSYEDVKKTPKAVTIDLGTPLIATHSPFGKLPDRNNFSVNISDVINFENLPDAIGTYGKMVGSIAKIRQFNAKNNES